MSEDVFLPPLEWVRPVGLGTLGSNSYFEEPYTIRSPHRVHIGDDVRIGARALLSVVEQFKGTRYDAELTIGDGCDIGRDLFVACVGRVDIGRRVGMSARVFIGDTERASHDVDISVVDHTMREPSFVRIEDDVAIGVGAILLPGVTLGERSIVGAGSVVTRSVPPRCIVFGNPARIIRSYSEEAGRWVNGPPRS